MSDVSTYLIALPALVTAIGGLIVGLNGRREIKAKADLNYVTLTREATDLLLERMKDLKEDHAKCNRNIHTLRTALVKAGVPVPELE